jgi:transposase
MSSYNNFIGIDIGKFTFVAAKYGDKTTKEYDNNSYGYRSFIRDFKKILKNSLCVLETTGGYEMGLLLTLCDKKLNVHRADTRKVKNFIRSFGNDAKTDSLDAKSLALYGFERRDRLELFVPQSENLLALYELIQRRQDLKQILVAEKNRAKAPRAEYVKNSLEAMINIVSIQIDDITKQINMLIEKDSVLKSKKEILKNIPGIVDIVSNELLILLPELGSLNRRQIASLCGLAPRANDSGKTKGYRSIKPGRNNVKPILFLAAMSARNSNSHLRLFYENLINRGKKKMVALVALMRKIIIIANAKLKEFSITAEILS